jgi:uncharacterized protein with NRDE domain
MCLIAFAYKAHPKYDLILAANRDEFYERPTRSAQFWDEYPKLLAGKDLLGGGSWMGTNKQGQFAALTNYRDPSISKDHPPSRGEIVTNYLTQEKDSESFFNELDARADRYMGFNLLAGSPRDLHHYSNREQQINAVQPGVHGLSNHLLDTSWPKVEKAKSDLQELLKTDKLREEALFEILLNDHPAPDKDLPDTGIAHDLEKQVSPIFIKGDAYGTHSSSILIIDITGKVTLEERRFKKGTEKVDETSRFEFKIERG